MPRPLLHGSDWTLIAPNRKPIPVRVSAVAGDSIVTEAGPYASFVRKGLMVRTRTIQPTAGWQVGGHHRSAVRDGRPGLSGLPPHGRDPRAIVVRWSWRALEDVEAAEGADRSV